MRGGHKKRRGKRNDLQRKGKKRRKSKGKEKEGENVGERRRRMATRNKKKEKRLKKEMGERITGHQESRKKRKD